MKNTTEAPRHFLDIADLNREELERVLSEAMAIRGQIERGILKGPTPLHRKKVAYISSKESLRTKASIGQASGYLGGDSKDFGKDSIFDEKGESRESFSDIGHCLEEQGYPVTFARLHKHEHLLQLAQGRTRMSVINALTDQSHPLQALADAEAYRLVRPDVKRPRVVFSGDGNNVATSLAEVSAMQGWDFVHTGPDSRQIRSDRWDGIQRLASEHGGSASYIRRPEQAVEGADYVYADVFASMGQKGNAAELNALMMPYQVNGKLMELAHPEAVFGHCLPAQRGIAVTSDVIDGPQSIVFTIAGCRMDTTAAIMKFLVKNPSWFDRLKDYFTSRVKPARPHASRIESDIQVSVRA